MQVLAVATHATLIHAGEIYVVHHNEWTISDDGTLVSPEVTGNDGTHRFSVPVTTDPLVIALHTAVRTDHDHDTDDLPEPLPIGPFDTGELPSPDDNPMPPGIRLLSGTPIPPPTDY